MKSEEIIMLTFLVIIVVAVPIIIWILKRDEEN